MLATACDAAAQVGLPSDRVLLFSEKENAPVNGVSDWHVVLGGDAAVESQRWKDMTEEEATQTVAVINYSSGTTGLPKGVCVSHYNVIANVAQIAHVKRMDKTWDAASERWIGKQARPVDTCLHYSDVMLGFLPLYHAYGQFYTCLVAPTLGVPVYMMKQFDFVDMLRCVETNRITRLQIAPPVMVLLGKRPETLHYDLSSLKDITCGAAPLSRELQLDVAQKLNVSIKQGWGMTEATCGGLNTEKNEKITGSVGVLFPNMEGKLVDDDGREVTDGQPGEFWLRGPNVSLGYWKNEKATRETFTAEGWLKTGDVAILRGDSLYMVDRKKVICSAIFRRAAVANLRSVGTHQSQGFPSGARGAGSSFARTPRHCRRSCRWHAPVRLANPDDEMKIANVYSHDLEHPRAYIVLKPGNRHKIQEADIHDWIRSRVARHKYLTGGIAFVNEVPKNASGKILRKVLREWAKRDATIMSNSPRSSKL